MKAGPFVRHIVRTAVANILLVTPIPIPEKVYNFSPHYTPAKRKLANLIAHIADIRLEEQENYLSKDDYLNAKAFIRKGDILLVGDLRHASRYFVTGYLTHTLIYCGKGKCIHAVANGVEEVSMRKIFNKYDTAAILRCNTSTPKEKKKFIRLARKEKGMPYDFEMEEGDESTYYCSELALKISQKAGIKITTKYKPHLRSTLAPDAIHPLELVGGNLETIFLSHNLTMRDDKIELARERSQNII